MKDENGESWFVGKDVAGALGYANPSKAVIMHVDEDDKVELLVYLDSQNGNAGQRRKTTFINESGLYSLILSSKLEGAKRFKHWVTSVVLPQIRKTGGYIPVETGDDEKSILAKALLICQKTIERQQDMLEAQQPDVMFASAVRASDGSILIGNLAKLIAKNGVDIGQNRLFRWMRENGYLGKAGRHRNVATQRYVEQGLFELEESTIELDSRTFVRITTLVTGAGQEYFVNGFVSGRFNPL